MPQINAVAAFVLLGDTNKKAVETPEPYTRGLSNKYTTYIKCTSDETFSLQFLVIPSKLAQFGLTGANLAFFVEIDGERVSYGAVCGPRGFETRAGDVAVWDCKMKGEFISSSSVSELHQFKFAKVQAVEQAPRTIKGREAISKLGEIAIYVHHIEYDNNRVALPISNVGKTPEEIGTAAFEGARLSHTVRLGSRTTTQIPPIRCSRFVEGKMDPIQVFRFKYRSKEALQELGILQSPVGPRPRPTLIHQQLSSEPPPRAPLTAENLLKNFPPEETTAGTRGRSDDRSSMFVNEPWIEPVRLRIQKDFGFSTAEEVKEVKEVNMGEEASLMPKAQQPNNKEEAILMPKAEQLNNKEEVSLMPKATAEGGEVRKKVKFSLKRKAGYNDSEDDNAFRSEKTTKRMR